MGIFNKKTLYFVKFHVGVGSEKDILNFSSRNTEFLISNQELTKENEKRLMQELEEINEQNKLDGFRASIIIEKEKCKKSDIPKPEMSFEEMRGEAKSLTQDVWKKVWIKSKSNDIKKYTKQEFEEQVVSKFKDLDRGMGR